MAKDFFHRDMQLFIDHRFDWARYFKLRRGDGVAVADEVATFKDDAPHHGRDLRRRSPRARAATGTRR